MKILPCKGSAVASEGQMVAKGLGQMCAASEDHKKRKKGKIPSDACSIACTPKDFRTATQADSTDQGTVLKRGRQDNQWRRIKPRGTQRVRGA